MDGDIFLFFSAFILKISAQGVNRCALTAALARKVFFVGGSTPATGQTLIT